MCGIAGIVNLDGRPVVETVLKGMADIMRHRGPDNQGIVVDGSVGLAHRRLSIIDLSVNANQPLTNEDGSLAIVHSGEIYNYRELRQELVRAGHTFRSNSDTEVIVHAYEEWQDACLNRFNGMWAFAIWDRTKRGLFLARDRFGVKPLYYYFDGDTFAFASEIKALLAHPAVASRPNDRSLYHYLISGYGYMDISDETFFENVRQVKPAHAYWLSFDRKRLDQNEYWDIDPSRKAAFAKEQDIVGRFSELFEDAVRLRLRSDVPVGVSLSGGLDSSSVACVASRLLPEAGIEAFSSCFEEARFDERRFIQSVLKKTGMRPNFIFASPENLFEDLDQILWHQEEPYATLSIFPQWYVMKLAHQKGVKVLLTGQAGDETLAGYTKYLLFNIADLVRSMRIRRAQREIEAYRRLETPEKRPVASSTAKILASYVVPEPVKNIIRQVRQRSIPRYLNEAFVRAHGTDVMMHRKFSSILNNDLYNALKVSPLPSLLHIDDRSSMAHSVESRSPFLDYRLVEFLFSIPTEYKIRDGVTKYILRRSMEGILPEDVRLRKDKLGFPTPLEQWFKTTLRTTVEEILYSPEFSRRPYFNAAGVRKEFSEYLKGKELAQYTIWSWVNLELWFRKFIDNPSPKRGSFAPHM